jgi:menaquinone-dependent protoporphyrinogen IX oxidase
MKTLVVYYSNTGSNNYLAEQIARVLECDSEPIKPRFDFFPALMLFSLVKFSAGIRALTRTVKEYDRIILCGPVWMGQLISPLRDFINKYRRNIKNLYFVTCCGSSDAAKDEKFGHALVFRKVKLMLGDKCVRCDAFPIGLVLPEDRQKDGNVIMKTRLSDHNFTGEIQKRFETLVQRMT